MIKRQAEIMVHELARQFPAVLILGPRQCGKTTLAKYFLEGEYFDLEKPSDQQIFLDDIEFALQRLQPPLIIDEAQTLPALFPVLRSMIDLDRQRTGSYYLLGSVNPALIKHISESLAGRVGIVELTPFLFSELNDLKIVFTDFWLKGGFPDALKEKENSKWQRWQDNYLRTFIERDVPRFGVKMSAIQIRRLMVMLAHQHGGLLNASDLGRSLGVSYHTIGNYLDLMEGHFLIRRLPPYFPNIKKRIVKSPKIYIRDSGALHNLLGVSSEKSLLESPKRGNSWEGFMIEQIINREMLERPGSLFYFFRTHAGAEIDLIIDRGSERIGYEFKCSVSVVKRDWTNLQTGIEQGVIHRGFVVYMGERDFPVTEAIRVVNGENVLIS
ncbi:MAG: ATP-binding protein [Desulfobacterales bacterium]|jgi:predicted AAA+ superfamily ATPase